MYKYVICPLLRRPVSHNPFQHILHRTVEILTPFKKYYTQVLYLYCLRFTFSFKLFR